MNKILLNTGKILLGLLVFLLFSFLVFWYKIYSDNKKKGLNRIIDSFAGALLYFVWGLLATYTGDVGPFNFILSIYGIDPK
uniref:Uncharacterized protein n=1 Tax=viral metagenome TaxID=1070528 RepID=A0A6C0C5M4_9ZZZZ